MFVSVRDADKPRIVDSLKLLIGLGFKVIATSGTKRYLDQQGVPSAKINKVLEGRPHIVDAIKNGDVQLVFNTTEGAQALADSRSLRAAALLHKVPYYTTLSGAVAAARGIKAFLEGRPRGPRAAELFRRPELNQIRSGELVTVVFWTRVRSRAARTAVGLRSALLSFLRLAASGASPAGPEVRGRWKRSR